MLFSPQYEFFRSLLNRAFLLFENCSSIVAVLLEFLASVGAIPVKNVV